MLIDAPIALADEFRRFEFLQTLLGGFFSAVKI
jgi:hypothetical protein